MHLFCVCYSCVPSFYVTIKHEINLSDSSLTNIATNQRVIDRWSEKSKHFSPLSSYLLSRLLKSHNDTQFDVRKSDRKIRAESITTHFGHMEGNDDRLWPRFVLAVQNPPMQR